MVGAIGETKAAAVSIQGWNFGFCEAPAAGWGTWIRTRTDGVRVRCSAVKLFPTKVRKRSADTENLSPYIPFGHCGDKRRGDAGRLKRRSLFRFGVGRADAGWGNAGPVATRA